MPDAARRLSYNRGMRSLSSKLWPYLKAVLSLAILGMVGRQLLRDLGNVPEDDLRRTFNLGIGMVFVIPGRQLTAAVQLLKKIREPFFQIGSIVPRTSKRQPKVLYQ